MSGIPRTKPWVTINVDRRPSPGHEYEDLVTAVAYRAIMDYTGAARRGRQQSNVHERLPKALRLEAEAEGYIFAKDEAGWPFSFVNACSLQGIDPHRARTAIRERRCAMLEIWAGKPSPLYAAADSRSEIQP